VRHVSDESTITTARLAQRCECAAGEATAFGCLVGGHVSGTVLRPVAGSTVGGAVHRGADRTAPSSIWPILRSRKMPRACRSTSHVPRARLDRSRRVPSRSVLPLPSPAPPVSPARCMPAAAVRPNRTIGGAVYGSPSTTPMSRRPNSVGAVVPSITPAATYGPLLRRRYAPSCIRFRPVSCRCAGSAASPAYCSPPRGCLTSAAFTALWRGRVQRRRHSRHNSQWSLQAAYPTARQRDATLWAR